MIHASLLSHPYPRQSENQGGIYKPGKQAIEILGNDMSLFVDNDPALVRANLNFGSGDPSKLEALEALNADVEHIPEEIDQQYQTRLFLESIINDTEPRVPIEVPRNHVELVRAIYKSAEEHQPVTLPLDKDDPFYGREGRLT